MGSNLHPEEYPMRFERLASTLALLTALRRLLRLLRLPFLFQLPQGELQVVLRILVVGREA